MSEPVDVQAGRLRELAADATPGPWRETQPDLEIFQRDGRRVFVAEADVPDDAAFIAACDPQTVLGLLDLLAGQAEQIERASLDVAKLSTANAELEDERDAVVRQRDNLRDALQQAERDLLAIYNAGFDSSRREIANRAIENVRVALRAADVDEGTDA